jgi:hypothetical protein
MCSRKMGFAPHSHAKHVQTPRDSFCVWRHISEPEEYDSPKRGRNKGQKGSLKTFKVHNERPYSPLPYEGTKSLLRHCSSLVESSAFISSDSCSEWYSLLNSPHNIMWT